MAAGKAKINDKNIIYILIATVILSIVLAFNGNAKLKSVVDSSEDINENIVKLNTQMTSMGQKTLSIVTELSKQRDELDELRKKLTQERLKNVQLQGEVEGLGSRSGGSAASAPAPASETSGTSVN